MGAELLDTPFRREDLPPDFSINRFGFRFEGDLLLIKEGKPKNAKSLVQSIVALVFACVFGFLVLMGLVMRMDFFITAVFFAVALFSFVYAIRLLMNRYFTKKEFELGPNYVIIRKSIGKERRFSKDMYTSVYVRNLILNGSESIEIRLRKKERNHTSADFTLLTLDLPNTPWFSSQKARENSVQSKEEAFQIGKIISDYWKLPFKV